MANNVRPAAVNRLLSAQQTAYRPAGTAAPRETELITAPEGSPAMTAREVQDVVRANSAQSAAASQAAATALPTSGMGVTGMGRYGNGAFYGLVGPGGKIADDNAAAFVASAPGAYQSPYADAMQRTLNGLLNPEPFRYDVNADGLYQQIKDQYTKAGRQAMMDTQGQSAALTGGYGNSYGAMAGQQAYQESLGNLAGMIPELQQLAYQQWRNGQDDQRNNLEALNKLDAQEYARWQDEQEAYQKLLATLPAAARASLGGGGGGLNTALPALTGGAGQAAFAVDPNVQMALADYVAKMGGDEKAYQTLYNMRSGGISLTGAPDAQVDYFLNSKLGLTRTDPRYLNGNYTVGTSGATPGSAVNIAGDNSEFRLFKKNGSGTSGGQGKSQHERIYNNGA